MKTMKNQVGQVVIIGRVKNMLDNSIVNYLEKEEIAGGMCYALSLEWVRCMGNGEVNKAIELNINDFSDAKLAYHKQIASNFFHYACNMGMSSTLDRSISFLIGLTDKLKVVNPAGRKEQSFRNMTDINQWYVNTCSGGELVADTTYGFPKVDDIKVVYSKKYDSEPGVFLVGTSNHQMAFAHIVNGGKHSLYFYDPNVGTIEADSIDEIVDYIRRNYGTNIRYDICRVVKKK